MFDCLTKENTNDQLKQIHDILSPFFKRAISLINKKSGKQMIEDSAINPFLAKCLGLNDFESLARYYVYQHIGRSVVTSFGSNMEKMIKVLFTGKRGIWWDVVRKTPKINYYVSVKSGPNDMDKDQAEHFAMEAKKIMKKDPKAFPVICMAYGKNQNAIPAKAMKDKGINPKKHMTVGKKAYEIITGDPNFLKKVFDVAMNVKSSTGANKTILESIDEKVIEVTNEFKKKYKTIDKLYYDTF